MGWPTDEEFHRSLRADAIAQLEQAETTARLFPADVRESVSGERLAGLRNLIRQYDEFLAPPDQGSR